MAVRRWAVDHAWRISAGGLVLAPTAAGAEGTLCWCSDLFMHVLGMKTSSEDVRACITYWHTAHSCIPTRTGICLWPPCSVRYVPS